MPVFAPIDPSLISMPESAQAETTPRHRQRHLVVLSTCHTLASPLPSRHPAIGAAVATTFKLIASAQQRWRAVDARYLVALARRSPFRTRSVRFATQEVAHGRDEFDRLLTMDMVADRNGRQGAMRDASHDLGDVFGRSRALWTT